MADKGGKRKAWVYDKEAKIPRSTAWRSKTREKGNVDSSSASDSMVTSLDFEGTSLSSCSVSGHVACFNDFESDHNDHSSSQPQTSPTNSDHIIETLCHDQTNGDAANPAVDEFLSFIADSDSDASATDTKVKLNELTRAQTVNLTASMKMKQMMLSRTFKRILKRSAMTVCHCTTVLMCRDLEQ